MMTLEEMYKCMNEKIPVVVYNRPDSIISKLVGLIDVISEIKEENLERYTYKEHACWVLFPDGIRSFVWQHEIRPARLKNPFVMNRVFVHTTSNRYGADDRIVTSKEQSRELSSKRTRVGQESRSFGPGPDEPF